MRITGNLRKARKKKIPEATPMRVKRELWLRSEGNTVLPLRSCGHSEREYRGSASSVWRPVSSQHYLEPLFVGPGLFIVAEILLAHQLMIIIMVRYVVRKINQFAALLRNLSSCQKPSRLALPLRRVRTPRPFFLPLRRWPLYTSPSGVDS
jgi:hypothetical protein